MIRLVNGALVPVPSIVNHGEDVGDVAFGVLIFGLVVYFRVGAVCGVVVRGGCGGSVVITIPLPLRPVPPTLHHSTAGPEVSTSLPWSIGATILSFQLPPSSMADRTLETWLSGPSWSLASFLASVSGRSVALSFAVAAPPLSPSLFPISSPSPSPPSNPAFRRPSLSL
ncbi:hypothetical protein K402DRAFT_240104 [Aulographum hederae CBS 113979]|uniref:Uncharacterized protein n=1 Tax=Aulographum hederae CBS 113979 TaxID=1176131 RepID=A0A6G1GKI0_9PEZI|nr:hypothetical protein K402DRAFT_240104 [Aulographum hederae CBS 113979]